jgi:ubiquitin carboxyl-terminal hydrolase 8
MVDFNVNELDLKSVVKINKPRYTKLKLYAVSNHYGTMDAGHYTAYCKNAEYNKWFDISNFILIQNFNSFCTFKIF